MIDRFKDRLSEYLDGDLDPRDEALIEAHLVECATCRATLAELRAVVARATALPPAEPKADLWSGVLARIEADAMPASGDAEVRHGAAAMLPGSGLAKAAPRPRTRRRRRISFSVPQLAAASVALALASGTGVWVALNIGSPERATESVEATGMQTVVENPVVARLIATEQRNTIVELERLLAAQRDSLDPVTVAVLESNLKIIDAAIAEAVAALAREPGNTYLSRHLDDTVERKIDVLRRAAQVARAEI